MSERILLLVLVAFVFSTGVNVHAQQITKSEVIGQARKQYYNLSDLGFVSCQARVVPNWKVAVKDVDQNPEAVRLLNGLKFAIHFDTNEMKVSHEATIPAPNSQTEAGYKSIFEGLDKQLTGFFATWKLFMLGSPFPAETAGYQLKDQGATYLVSFKEPGDSVEIVMTKDLTMSEVRVDGPTFKATIKPQFTKSRNGNLLSGYYGVYNESGTVSEVDVRIDYQDVSGLQLPSMIRFSVIYNGTAADSELAIVDHQVKRKDTIKDHQ